MKEKDRRKSYSHNRFPREGKEMRDARAHTKLTSEVFTVRYIQGKKHMQASLRCEESRVEMRSQLIGDFLF